jgi:predicted acylesterase/phospholipase RssA
MRPDQHEALKKGTKRGLLLTGGGTKGAFQIGALKYMLGELGRTYDMITGFSIGALTGAMVVQRDFDRLVDIWENTRSLRRFFGGNLAFYRGLLSMRPLKRLIEEMLDEVKLRSSPVRFVFTTVDLQEGRLIERNKFSSPLVDWLLASCAIPGVFAPVEIDGHQYVDGGVMATHPLAPAIREGMDEIDLLLCRPLTNWRVENRTVTIFETVQRSLSLIQAEMVRVDINRCREINRAIEKWGNLKGKGNVIEGYILRKAEDRDHFPLRERRYVKLNIIDPPSDLINVLEFNQSRIHFAMEAGYSRARGIFEET